MGLYFHSSVCCRVIVVCIATHYSLEGPGFVPLWERDFPYPSSANLVLTHLLFSLYRLSFPGVNRLGRGVSHPPLLASRLRISGTIPLFPIRAFMARYRDNFVTSICLCDVLGVGSCSVIPLFTWDDKIRNIAL